MNQPLASTHIQALCPYQPGKPIDELKRELGLQDVVKLASNENPCGPSPKALEAIQTDDLYRYPDPNAYALRTALAAHHKKTLNHICLGNGSNELIDLMVRVFCTPDDHVVFGDPSFLCYRIACVASNVPHTAVLLRDNLHWNVDDLLDAVQSHTKVVFIANPNNPTGAYISGSELERLLHGLPKKTIAVIDEAYVEYATATDYQSALNFQKAHPLLVVLRTFSKAYGLAALRVGYAISTQSIVADLNRLRAPFNVNTIGQRLALAALNDQAHIARSVASNTEQRECLAKTLQERGYEVAPSQANFVLTKASSRPGAELYQALLKKGVIVRNMPAPIDRWIRISVGTATQNNRLLSALDSIQGNA